MPHNPPQHVLELPHHNINPHNKLIQIVLQYLKHFLEEEYIISLQLFLWDLDHRHDEITKILHTILTNHQQVLL